MAMDRNIASFPWFGSYIGKRQISVVLEQTWHYADNRVIACAGLHTSTGRPLESVEVAGDERGQFTAAAQS